MGCCPSKESKQSPPPSSATVETSKETKQSETTPKSTSPPHAPPPPSATVEHVQPQPPPPVQPSQPPIPAESALNPQMAPIDLSASSPVEPAQPPIFLPPSGQPPSPINTVEPHFPLPSVSPPPPAEPQRPSTVMHPEPQFQPPPVQPIQPPSPAHDPTSTSEFPPIERPSPQPVLLPTVENCISLFQSVRNAADVAYLIDLLDKILKSLLNRPKQETTEQRSIGSETLSDGLDDRTNSLWTSLLLSGSLFLEFVNKHIQLEKEELELTLAALQGDEGNRQVVVGILQSVGKVHWVVGGLAVVAFLLDQIGQISENRAECIDLLKQMVKLAELIRKLNYDMPQEEKILSEAITLIVQGSMLCASQLKSRSLFRFLKASVNSKSLATLQSKINQVYQDLTLRVAIEIQHQQPIVFRPWQPIYPDYAIGIEQQKNKVVNLLDMKAEDKPLLAVVIYGFGGIGKTTLATGVLASLDLRDYNYSAVQIQEDRSRNDIKCMQQQILKDAFPAYTYDRNIILRNSGEGRDHLTSAFIKEGNEPVFLFIDNTLRAEDLQELFPKRLSGLPKRSRILVTTRNLGETDMLKDAGLERHEYLVGTLPDQHALKILRKDELQNTTDKGSDSVQKALQICGGIPLVLEIVGARLRKQNYMVERCTQIFEALERGDDIRGENLSQRLVNSVYNELELSTREAFLDICCFFVNWSRHDVECIMGAEDITLLEEAALVKTSDKGELIVHDIIKAKGRSLSQCSRIMDMQSWLEVVHDDQKLKQIKGLSLGMKESESAGHEVEEKHLHLLKSSLRVLCLESQIKVSGSSKKQYKFMELRFLRLGGDISALWPANLELLDRMTVFHGPVFKDGVTLYQLPKRLRLMKATAQSHCEESEQGKIIQNSSLEELDLKALKSIQKLPKKMGHLTGLKILILDEWDKMQDLPEQVCGLPSLCRLSICGASSLKNLANSFGQLTSLKELMLTSCKQLEELPSTFGDLISLKHLCLAECVNLKCLSLNFGKLGSLEVLNLDGCSKLETFPSSFWELSSLKELRCSSMELEELPADVEKLTSLKHLDLGYCMKLKSLPSSIGKLQSLDVLSLFACKKLEVIPSNIWDLPSLRKIDLRGCPILREFSSSSMRRRPQEPIVRLPDHLAK